MSEMQRGLMAKRWQQRQFRPAPALKRRSRLVFDAFEVLDLASKVRVNHWYKRAFVLWRSRDIELASTCGLFWLPYFWGILPR